MLSRVPCRISTIWVVLALFVCRDALADDERPWRVLLLSDDFAMPASVTQMQAMEEELELRAGRPVEVYRESLDLVRFSGAEEAQATILRAKYSDVPLDLVVTLAPQSLLFAARHLTTLRDPSLPIVAFSVTEENLRDVQAHTMAAMTIPFDVSGTLDLAFALHPDRRRLAVVAGRSRYDQNWLARARTMLDARDDVIDVTYPGDGTLDEVIERIRTLPPDALVLYLSFTADAAGSRFASRDVAKRISEASPVPVYGIFESYVGYGAVATMAPSFVEHGKAAGELVLRVLNGEPGASLHVAAAPNPRCVADARELDRWRLETSALPLGCEIVFQQPSFWEQFRWQILGGLAVIALQAALIGGLLVQRRRSRAAAVALEHERNVAAHAARLATLGELSASIAHEISQPLAAILSNAEAGEMLLGTKAQNASTSLKEIFADIREDDLRAHDVVRRVRSLAQRRTPALQALDVNQVVADARRLLDVDAPRRGVVFEWDLAPLPLVNGDRVQLQQVIINLAVNAMDALSGQPPPRRRVVVKTRCIANQVQVSVRDYGSGIPDEHAGRLFESFFTTKPDGVGLGLSITRSIVAAHGGTIHAENRSDGALFMFSLPTLVTERHVATGVANVTAT
jgi:signal transduction histidine kinase